METDEVVRGKPYHLLVDGKMINTTFTGEKVWLIFDGRARVMDTDDCVVYEAFSSHDETLKDVHQAIRDRFEDGVIFEYDEVAEEDGKKYIVNQRKLN